MCLGVRKNIFYEYNTFLSLNVAYTDDYLNVSSSERIYLDVFLNKPAYFPYCFTESAGICSDFEVFPFARDLFAAFCSVLVRMHLILHKLLDINYLFFYEFFDLFRQVNASDCFVICSDKPKFGPYCGTKGNLEIIMFQFLMFTVI